MWVFFTCVDSDKVKNILPAVIESNWYIRQARSCEITIYRNSCEMDQLSGSCKKVIHANQDINTIRLCDQSARLSNCFSRHLHNWILIRSLRSFLFLFNLEKVCFVFFDPADRLSGIADMMLLSKLSNLQDVQKTKSVAILRTWWEK